MNREKSLELTYLKTALWIYIAAGLIIAGLNYGYTETAAPAVADFINRFWHFYENSMKTILILFCSYLTLKIVGQRKRIELRKKNLRGFIVFALLVHGAGPHLLNNPELYLFTMPLPWNTVPLQLLSPESSFYLSRFPLWGSAGITAALVFYTVTSAVILGGTLVLGRRLQCSTLCLFNGFVAEVFAPAFPLARRAIPLSPRSLNVFALLRWVFLFSAFCFTLLWVLHLFGVPLVANMQTLRNVELYKYLGGELLAAMFFWVFFLGRGYCYYCPLGTVLSVLGKAAGQKIITNKTTCIQCGQCNRACPMAIDIQGRAQFEADVTDLRCVGCGHCVDTCPMETLEYSTRCLAWHASLKRKDHKNPPAFPS